MSEPAVASPFPLEQSAQEDTGQRGYNPWQSEPKPGVFGDLFHSDDYGYLAPVENLAAIPGSSVAKGELMLAGMLHTDPAPDPMSKAYLSGRITDESYQASVKSQAGLDAAADAIKADAKMRLQALSPDPRTAGVALRTVHSVPGGLTTMLVGGAVGGPGGAAALVGGTEGAARFEELRAAGVDELTARRGAAITGGTAALGAVMPMVFGEQLATRLLSGAASNVAFGAVGRGLDSELLRAHGYTEMADQEQIFDRSQILLDALLGIGYGGIHHALAPGRTEHLANTLAEYMGAHTDAALTWNLALRDRQSGPGVPVDPRSMNAHGAALEKAVNDLQDGEHVDVAGTGIEEADVLPREGHENPEVEEILREHIAESGLLDEYDKLHQLNEALEGRFAEAKPPGLGRGQVKPSASTDSMLEYLAKHPDGISSSEAEAQGIDPADMRLPAAYFGIRRAFRKNGMTFDEAAEHLSEAGFAVTDEQGRYSPNVLLERLDDELRGRKHYSVMNEKHVDQVAQNLRERYEQIEADSAARADHVPSVPTLAEDDPKVKALVKLAEQARYFDTEKTDRVLADRQHPDPRTALEEIINDGEENQRQRSAAAREGTLRAEQARDSGQTLESYTERDLAERERGRAAAERADLERVRAFAARQAADRDREQFALTGSARISDSNPRQGDLISAARAKPNPYEGLSATDREHEQRKDEERAGLANIANAAVAEHPHMMVEDQGVEVPAKTALERSNARTRETTTEAPKMFEAAADCFLRRGV